MGNYRKGANFEREIVNDLNMNGWTAQRVAGSGTASYATCDIVAVRNYTVLFLECKSNGVPDRKEEIRDDIEQLEEMLGCSNSEVIDVTGAFVFGGEAFRIFWDVKTEFKKSNMIKFFEVSTK